MIFNLLLQCFYIAKASDLDRFNANRKFQDKIYNFRIFNIHTNGLPDELTLANGIIDVKKI